MTKERTLQAEVGGYISALLRRHFGKGPTSVYVTVQSSFLVVHIRGFLAPMEKMLLKQNERNRVLKTRDLLMRDLKKEITEELKEIAEMDVAELYADWDLEKETGLLIGVLKEAVPEETLSWPEGVSEGKLIEKIEQASNNVEKVPGSVEVFWLSDRMVLVKRTKILVEIEKELIRSGFEEELRIAKRPLELRVMEAAQLETVLNRKIAETFFDWNFDTDLSYMVFILDPVKQM